MHYKAVGEILSEFSSNKETGLSEQEAQNRLSKYGKNIFVEKRPRTLLDVIFAQFRNSLLWLLIAAALVSFAIDEHIESVAIFAAVLLSVAFGAYLEYKADKSLDELKKLTQKKALVLREGEVKLLSSELVVPGDILILESGNYIPADAIIIESYDLRADEASLTGESLSVQKRSGIIEESTVLAERFNTLYAGTYITRGQGKALIYATGKQTEFGKIAKGLGDISEENTPLRKSLDDIGKKISILSLVLIGLFFLIGYFQQRDLAELFLVAVTLAVAAIPEGLTAVLTIILTLSVIEMAKHKALVRKLESVETIGNIDYIATDKTGTITRGELSLIYIYKNRKLCQADKLGNDMRDIVEMAVICNTANKDSESNFVGDDIDTAILKEAERLGINVEKARKANKISKIIPFSSDRKYMQVRLKEKNIEILKGAPEILLKQATHVMHSKIESMTEADSDEISRQIDVLASSGFRILALLKKEGKKNIFEGLLAFADPEKPNITLSIETAKEAGIRPVMLTGDNLKTAMYIAKKVGIAEDDSQGIEWSAIKDLGDSDLYLLLEKKAVIARATPESKLRLVQVMINHGHVVSVTGDGINDALALKKAQVGIVMGKKGTDVSKEVADLILLDDNFSTLLKAVEYGRTMFHNILNFIKFQFTANISALAVMFLSFLMNLKFPLMPLQLLWINIIMDGPPALSLGFEKSISDVMKQKPRGSKKMMSNNLIASVFASSLFISIVVFGVFLHYYGESYHKAVAMAFNTFVFFNLFNALNCRFVDQHPFKNIRGNLLLFFIVVVMALIQIFINYIPFMNELFLTYPLTVREWGIIFLVSSSIILIEEIKKSFSFFRDL